MRGNNVLGIIFSNMHDESIREMTDSRTMGSVPFGGRYRLIDFPLSNMSNSGVTKVGVVTKSNYRSLMDHLGSGKSWDLSRKREGLILLPPYGSGNAIYENRLQALGGIRDFLASSHEEYVFLSDCDVICNLDVQDVVDYHIKNNADITVVYKRGMVDEKTLRSVVVGTDENGRITDMMVSPRINGECDYGLNMYVMRRDFLEWMVSEAITRNMKSFEKDILQASVSHYCVMGYECTGFTAVIGSMSEYFSANMQLLLPDVRENLFVKDRPIYTKVKDDMPARYGLGSEVKNSLVADGCVIEGAVENCILFRGVHIGKGAKVQNSIIMQASDVGAGANLSYVITDKNVIIKPDRTLMGFDSYPVFIRKGSVV